MYKIIYQNYNNPKQELEVGTLEEAQKRFISLCVDLAESQTFTNNKDSDQWFSFFVDADLYNPEGRIIASFKLQSRTKQNNL
jgi:hypothetical protein